MAPLLFALLLLAQDAVAASAPADGPVATALPRKQEVAPLPIQGGPVAPPTDDYGYVAWCLGAVGGYVDLYDRAMPEVIRIERAWPTPSTEENIKVVYPGQKKEAMSDIDLFKRAIEAAEKASPTPISSQGAAAIKKGRALWTGSNTVPKAQLAQFWMSWSPPAKCAETARALEQRSNLFGQALTYNAKPADKPAEAAAEEAKPQLTALAPIASEEAAPQAKADDAGPEAVADTVETARDEAANDEPAAGEDATTEEAASAIDDLVSAAADESAAAETPAPAAEDKAVEEAAPEETAPEAKAPPPATAKPASAAKAPKPGLKDTLKGLRGRQ